MGEVERRMKKDIFEAIAKPGTHSCFAAGDLNAVAAGQSSLHLDNPTRIRLSNIDLGLDERPPASKPFETRWNN